MTEIRNVEQELSRFNTRLLAAGAFVLFGFDVAEFGHGLERPILVRIVRPALRQ